MSRRNRSDKIKPAPPAGVTDTAPKVGRPAPDVQKGWGPLPGILLILVVAVGGALLAATWSHRGDGTKADDRGDGKPTAKVQDATSAALSTLIQKGVLKADRGPWRPGPWRPTSAADAVIDRYMRLHVNDDPTAVDLLGGQRLTEGEVVREQDVEPRRTDAYLRALRVIGVWAGEPDAGGRQVPTPGRYTLKTKGAAAVHVTVSGQDALTSMNVSDPELVVEVKGGKIYGVRTELAR